MAVNRLPANRPSTPALIIGCRANRERLKFLLGPLARLKRRGLASVAFGPEEIAFLARLAPRLPGQALIFGRQGQFDVNERSLRGCHVLLPIGLGIECERFIYNFSTLHQPCDQTPLQHSRLILSSGLGKAS